MPDADPFVVAVGLSPAGLSTVIYMKETDLPCSECDAELVECTVHAEELPVSTGWRGYVSVAECRLCGARYSPPATLSKLTMSSQHRRTQSRGDS